MSPLYIPDTNEFHPMESYRGPIIVRTLYDDAHIDRAWASGDADKAAAQPWWGAYQYCSANADPGACAYAFKKALGGRRPWLTILDREEGVGDQQAFEHEWLAGMADDPALDWTYSGLAFSRTHGLNPQWVAAYGQSEPTTDHRLWQFSDAYQFPGMSAPCDASVFNGTLDDLIALTRPISSPPVSQEDDDLAASLYRNPQDGSIWCVSGAGRWHVKDATAELPLVEWSIVRSADVTDLKPEQINGFYQIPEIPTP